VLRAIFDDQQRHRRFRAFDGHSAALLNAAGVAMCGDDIA